MRERLNVSTTTTARHTVNYDLPQWNGEDVTSWMTNLNDAFNKIDSAMWENHTAMAGYDKIASDLQKLADDLRVDNSEIRETLGSIQIGMGEQLAQLNQAKQAITNANIAITQLQQEDNVLRGMVEDLQDDVGMMMNWRKSKSHVLYPEITGTVTGSDGATCNWRIESVTICNGMYQLYTRLTDPLTLEGDRTIHLEASLEDSNRLTACLQESYPPAQGEFTIGAIPNLCGFGLALCVSFIHKKTNEDRRWRVSIEAMKSGQLPAEQLIITKGMIGGLRND